MKWPFRRKTRADPKDALAGDSYRFYTGYSSSGQAVTERSAMQITAVYACVRVLSEGIASLPLHLYPSFCGISDEGGFHRSEDGNADD